MSFGNSVPRFRFKYTTNNENLFYPFELKTLPGLNIFFKFLTGQQSDFINYILYGPLYVDQFLILELKSLNHIL